MTNMLFATCPAPRTSEDPLTPMEQVDPIRNRIVNNPEYVVAAISALQAFDEFKIDDWAENKSDEEATRLIETFNLENDEDSPQESLLLGLRLTLYDFDHNSTDLHPLVALMGQEVLWEAVESLYRIEEVEQPFGTIWRGDYSHDSLIDVPLFVTGGDSWGEAPTNSFDAIMLIAESTIFDKPF